MDDKEKAIDNNVLIVEGYETKLEEHVYNCGHRLEGLLRIYCVHKAIIFIYVYKRAALTIHTSYEVCM